MAPNSIPSSNAPPPRTVPLPQNDYAIIPGRPVWLYLRRRGELLVRILVLWADWGNKGTKQHKGRKAWISHIGALVMPCNRCRWLYVLGVPQGTTIADIDAALGTGN